MRPAAVHRKRQHNDDGDDDSTTDKKPTDFHLFWYAFCWCANSHAIARRTDSSFVENLRQAKYENVNKKQILQITIKRDRDRDKHGME